MEKEIMESLTYDKAKLFIELMDSLENKIKNLKESRDFYINTSIFLLLTNCVSGFAIYKLMGF